MMEQGYDVEMASGEPIDPKYSCPVCLTVMRNAMQTVCGHRFCRSCILRVIGDRQWGKCPVDKTVFRRTDTHIKVCPMEQIDCPINCGAHFPRGQLESHQECCPQRRVTCSHCEQEVIFSQLHKHELLLCEKFPVTCKLCGEANILRKDISKHVDSAYGSCPQSNVPCKFFAAGCHFEVSQFDMSNRILLKFHGDIEHGTGIQLGRSELHISEHAVLLERLKERTISGRTHWRLNLQNMEPVPGMVFSPPFYTSCPGYMMRLRLDFNGVRDGEDYYSSVFIVLQRGEFDEELLFPFRGQIKVTLLTQSGGHSEGAKNISAVINCMEVPRNTTGAVNSRINSRGQTRFIKKTDLMAPPYCNNKIIFFEIAMVVPCDSCTGCTNGNLSRPPSVNP
ncbi:hypothetical protein C0Q70_00202 [Pomacea canaliculata]|uniref:TNF receptor-associated factor n=1 Tax=Pomacea canaliculata TaxID=400727 RepID=A0A2T7PW01_POMCA|nr:hypothetical protein C0Q70_00202 [Pomacea canaliculata]